MLPGFRFLLAATILSISILIFGLGAAALLRAAHEEFASNPTWRAPPETVFAQQSEPTKPVLATLVVEPPPAEQKKPEAQVTAAPEAPAVIVAPAAEPEQLAAARPAETSPAEAAKAQPVAETPPASELVPAEANAAPEVPAPATDIKVAGVDKIATIEAAPPPAGEAATAAPEQASVPATTETDQTATKVATRGDPLVAVEAPPPSKAESAAAEKSALKKRLRAQRARERRRLAALQRARLARQAMPLPTDLFAQQPTAPPQVR